ARRSRASSTSGWRLMTDQPTPPPDARRAAPDAASRRPHPRARRQPDAPGADGWAEIGVVVGVFGIRGELKVRPLTDFPARFTRTHTIYLGDDHTPYQIEAARAQKEQIILRLTGISAIEQAEPLRGQRLWIPEAELSPLAADQFYLHDLIGLRAEDLAGATLGTVSDVLSGSGNDLLAVRTPQGQDVLVPVVKAFIKAVDLAAGVIRIEPIPGLFDEATEDAR
ncbi:MAG TPA: ribosome maturation factor RimM, partial [Ktedonobacterales bacterium]